MSAASGKVVVVGVDGSDTSVEVLEFALREGLRRGVAVEVVTPVGFEEPAPGYGGPRTYAETRRVAQDKLLARARLGSVAEGCVARARLPVVVVPVGAPSKDHGAAGQLATSPVSLPDEAGAR